MTAQRPFDFAPLIRDALRTPTGDVEFYAKATRILLRPARVVSMMIQMMNLGFYVFVVCSLAWLGAQVADRALPFELISATPVLPQVAAGEPLRIFYKVKRLKSCRTTLNWTIIDGDRELHEYGPVIVESTGGVGRDDFVRAFTTSKNLTPGDGGLRVGVSMQCQGNYVQGLYPLTTTLPEVNFTILPPVGHDRATAAP